MTAADSGDEDEEMMDGLSSKRADDNRLSAYLSRQAPQQWVKVPECRGVMEKASDRYQRCIG